VHAPLHPPLTIEGAAFYMAVVVVMVLVMVMVMVMVKVMVLVMVMVMVVVMVMVMVRSHTWAVCPPRFIRRVTSYMVCVVLHDTIVCFTYYIA
jgi:hypothetical protein